MAIVHESFTTSTTATITKPSGAVVDDLLVAVVIYAGGDTTISIPGFTVATSTSVVAGWRFSVLSHVVTGTEGASFTVSPGDPLLLVGMSRFSGVDPTTPINAAASSNGGSGVTSTTHTAPTITTTAQNTWLLRAYSAFPTGTYSAIAGYAKHWDVTDSPDGMQMALYGKLQAATGSTGAQNVTGPNAQWSGASVALREAAPAFSADVGMVPMG